MTALVLSGCASGGAATPSGVAAASAPGVYRLGTGDKLRVIVFNEKEITGEYVVSSSGGIDIPLIGQVKAEGESVDEVQNRIQTLLAAGYIREPHVSVEVLSYRPFYILGEVEKPGEYPYSNGLTVPRAVARAGGYTYRADQKNIFIKRGDQAREQLVPITTDAPVSLAILFASVSACFDLQAIVGSPLSGN